MKYITDRNGNKYKVEFTTYIEPDEKGVDKVWVTIQSAWDYSEKYLTVYYRPERTWDDHMGNTPCGYYVNLPLWNGQKKRVYVY